MRLPVKRGRAIGYQDDGRAPAVVMINECAARRFWPGENPIGKRFVIGDSNSSQPPWLSVIGVTADASLDDMVSDPYPEMYLAALQTPEFLGEGSDPVVPHMSCLTLVARGDGDANALTRPVEAAVSAFDRNLPISAVLTMDEAVATATAQPRFEMLLLGLFGAVALALAAVGTYGVMNYSVARRTREIGIRMSLGASRGDVFRMVISQASNKS